MTPQTVAIMLEPIQGEGGVIPANDDFMKALRDLTSANNMLLIVDEVQSGMGRSGKLFAYQHSGVEPDIMTLGKGIGGGVPLAALLAKKEVCVFEAGDQGGTYNGNPLMTAVGFAVLQEISSPQLLEHINQMGQYLSQQLESVREQYHGVEVRGKGLLQALVFSHDKAAEIVKQARSLPTPLLINSPRPNTLRFMPALNVKKDEIDLMITYLKQAIEKSLLVQ
jgi:acetylornithine/N-succinyldiaminopimelate aminotransferase